MALTWERVQFPTGIRYAHTIVYGNGRWVICSYRGEGIFVESSPGIWVKTMDTSKDSEEPSLAFANGQFIAMRNTTESSIAFFASRDGTTWETKGTYVSSERECTAQHLAYGNGVYALGVSTDTFAGPFQNDFLYSEDLIQWKKATNSFPQVLRRATEIIFNGRFVCIGERDDEIEDNWEDDFVLLQSSDGKTWGGSVISPKNSSPSGFAYQFSTYFSGGRFSDKQRIMKSAGGGTWEVLYTEPDADAYGFLRSVAKNSKAIYSELVFRPEDTLKICELNNARDYTLQEVGLGEISHYGAFGIDYGHGEFRIAVGSGYLRALDPERPTLESLHPSGGFVDEKVVNRFSWSLAGLESHEPLVQKRADFYWRIKGETSASTVTVEGPATYVDIPADTFPNGKIEWQVRSITDGNLEKTSEWMELTTIDVTPLAPLHLAPDARLVDGTQPVLFSWSHNIGTGSAQSAFDIETSADGLAWQPLASGTTEQESYSAPAGAFAAGTLHWRVRTYSSDGDAGPWASASVTVQAAPEPPSISVSGTGPRPTVSWQTPDQISYQVTAGGYDSSEVYGTARKHKIREYLPDGEISIAVRVCDQYGLWSEWSAVTVRIANRPGEAIKLRSRSRERGAVLMWDGGGYSAYYVYRDGVLIGKTSGRTYTDWMTVGAHRYEVRGVTGDDNYAMSGSRMERTRVDMAAIAEVGVFEWIPLRYRAGEDPTVEGTLTPHIEYRQYSGRPLPVAEVYGYREVSYSLGYSVDTMTDYAKIAALAGKLVVCKDSLGTLAVGMLDGIEFSGKKGHVDFTLSITAVHQEAMSYDD